ncbi:MAG: HD-GYP domain-containing protein [Proteobacteria bacterium]|nr:MAG: HD-GYP domain-containing protein [Pseudomonadota bacterium]
MDEAVSYVPADELRVGLFVFVDLPWFRHPFAFDRFKIKTDSQIAQLKELGVARFRVDPARSDMPAPPPVVADTPAAPALPAEPAPVPDADTLARQRRRERNAARRARIARVERAFASAGQAVKEANRNLVARPGESLAALNQLVGDMAESMLSAPEVTLHAMADRIGGTETYCHELNTAVMSLMLARQLELPEGQVPLLGLGALVHDIGLAEIPDKVVKKRDPLTHAEAELRKLHCEYGVKRGHEIGLPPPVLAIIGQHHENWDGSGYPKGVSADRIHPLARVVALVNEYDNLCNPPDVMRALTPYEALSVLFTQRRNRFEGRVLQLLVRQLGVYPPGTVVALSDDRLGMVVSVNSRAPLRPGVMVYQPELPRDESSILNLAQVPEINIAKALRAADLPREVHDYLSPRTRVAYFFDTEVDLEVDQPACEAAA